MIIVISCETCIDLLGAYTSLARILDHAQRSSNASSAHAHTLRDSVHNVVTKIDKSCWTHTLRV